MNPTALSILEKQLSQKLPQEWLICQSTQTTCRGPVLLIRVELEPQPNTTSRLLCFILLDRLNGKIVVSAANITTPQTIKITKVIREITRSASNIFYGYCVTITECQLDCENCFKASQFYSAKQ